MEMKLFDGDYVHDGYGGFETVTGANEILNRVLFKLTARRGSFPLIPELGSRLYLLIREKPSDRLSAARQYIMEALSDEENISLDDVKLADNGSGQLDITAWFNYNGDEFEVELEV